MTERTNAVSNSPMILELLLAPALDAFGWVTTNTRTESSSIVDASIGTGRK